MRPLKELIDITNEMSCVMQTYNLDLDETIFVFASFQLIETRALLEQIPVKPLYPSGGGP